ncbi:MAG: ATP-binding cassette domain-containing protein [Bacteroidota bacterium]
MNVIDINKISFGYNAQQDILSELSLAVPQNSIFGLLGNNGVGKTTLIRIIVGLMRPRIGAIQLFGLLVREKRQELMSKIGILIESPSLYGHLTGLQNLHVFGAYIGASHFDIQRVIQQTGMESFQHKKSKQYSTGMKQRLGIAIALLRNPELLILDEPTNGLDPEGIVELRNLLYDLKQEGKTILVSSHLLSEIDKVATHIGILRKGKCIYNGPIEGFKHKDHDLEATYFLNKENEDYK